MGDFARLEALMDEQSVFGYAYEGTRYDAGTVACPSCRAPA